MHHAPTAIALLADLRRSRAEAVVRLGLDELAHGRRTSAAALFRAAAVLADDDSRR
jgi:hypothetical protein